MRRRLRKGGDSINSFMAWVGGKKALRDEILARFPRNYKRYIEVFGGAGWVLFHKPPGNDFEVFNDFNGNLVNLYRCVREQPEALRNELRYMLNAQNLVVAQLHSSGILNNAEYAAQSGELNRKVSELRSERRRILMEDEDNEVIESLRALDEIMADYAPTEDFDEDLFGQIVESITVVSKNALRFCLAGGLALTERI